MGIKDELKEASARLRSLSRTIKTAGSGDVSALSEVYYQVHLNKYLDVLSGDTGGSRKFAHIQEPGFQKKEISETKSLNKIASMIEAISKKIPEGKSASQDEIEFPSDTFSESDDFAPEVVQLASELLTKGKVASLGNPTTFNSDTGLNKTHRFEEYDRALLNYYGG